MFALRVEGGDELARHLADLSIRVQRKTLLDALVQGAEPIRSAMSRVPQSHRTWATTS
jgi:hypothetical protein